MLINEEELLYTANEVKVKINVILYNHITSELHRKDKLTVCTNKLYKRQNLISYILNEFDQCSYD